MFDIICNLPLPSELFSQALHPSEPLLTVGLASGHVQTYKLPAIADSAEDDPESEDETSKQSYNDLAHPSIISRVRRSSSASENGLGAISTVWETRRHKGSCRALTFGHDGNTCYSAGTDGLVKAFSTDSGRVISKIAIPIDDETDDFDAPTVLHALSPQALLLGGDSGKVYLYDLRQGGKEVSSRASQTWTPHGYEHVNSLIPLPASETSTSGFPKQWVTVGGTTLAVTDLRKGTIATSEDQEVELTSAVVVQGLKKGGTSVGEKVLTGQGDGIVSLWEKGVWDDMDDRIIVDTAGASVESLCVVPTELAMDKLHMNEKLIAAGLDDGRVSFLRIGRNGVLKELEIRHDDLEGVVAVGFDVGGRLVTGGGSTVKIWTEASGQPGGGRSNGIKHTMDSSDGNDEPDSDDSSDEEEEEEQSKPQPKKRKKSKTKNKGGGHDLNFSGIL